MGEELSEEIETVQAVKATKTRNWGLWLQVVPGIVGMFIGVLALYAALTEAEAVRKQQQASVWPFIGLEAEQTATPGAREFYLEVTNKGIGPARILYFDLRVDGVSQRTWYDMFAGLFFEMDEETDVNVTLSSKGLDNTVLAPNEKIRLLYLSQANAEDHARAQTPEDAEKTRVGQLAAMDLIIQNLINDRITLHICYCSVFDDCWMTHSAERERKKVNQCPTPFADSLL